MMVTTENGKITAKKAAGERKKIKNFNLNGCDYRVNDSILVNGQEGGPPYLAKINEIYELAEDKPMGERTVLSVTWYYRPEEAHGGRKTFHGKKELFKSDHTDEVHACTIIGPCYVHSLANYQTLQDREDDDFFARFTYHTVSKEFKPDRVPVYCTCELPYNPDQLMLCCVVCEDWFHPKCVGLEEDVAETLPAYKCKKCSVPTTTELIVRGKSGSAEGSPEPKRQKL